MPQLVLHTGGHSRLLAQLGSGLLEQRRLLRREGIGLRFRGIASPRKQWDQLAAAMGRSQHEPWQRALRWQRRWPRDTWLCSALFHRCLLRDRRFNHWRDWLEAQDLELRVVVHLLHPEEQSWQAFVERILQLKKTPPGASADADPRGAQVLLYNDLYNELIEAAGVCGARFVLHDQPRQPDWGRLLPPHGSMASTLDQPFWPSQAVKESPDPRLFALSLVVQQNLRNAAGGKPGKRLLRAAIATAAQQLPPLNQAEAKQMAREAGWSPPEGASLEEGLQRFASRVWGRSWPAPHPGNAEDTPGSDLPERRNAIAAAAAQLLSC